MEFRILANDDGQFKVQKKGWLFWYDVGAWAFAGNPNHPGELILGTREEAENLIHKCECELRQQNWRVIGGKVLPPRPWPAPPNTGLTLDRS